MNDAILFSPSVARPPLYDGFLSEAIAGLSRPQKTLPCKFLYDEQGSRLFNEICELEEYYPTRTENQILRDNINEIAGLIGRECRLVEFGSGASTKTRHLLTHLPSMSGYIPIDISGPQLLESAVQLAVEFPDLEISPLEADYGEISEIPKTARKPRRTVAFFPGSTIGNFDPVAAIAFMRNIALLCGSDGGLLIGVDLKKPRWILEPAYNDRKGVTAKFNLGILARANRELGANFDLAAFRHRAPYNEAQGRIEMHLVSTRAQMVHLDSLEFSFEEPSAAPAAREALAQFRAQMFHRSKSDIASLWAWEKSVLCGHHERPSARHPKDVRRNSKYKVELTPTQLPSEILIGVRSPHWTKAHYCWLNSATYELDNAVHHIGAMRSGESLPGN